MWQRIQTLYLAIALGLIISMIFGKIAVVIGPGGSEESVFLYEKTNYLILGTMALVGCISCLSTFKFRLLQMRVAVLVALILFGFQVWLGIDFFRYRLEMNFTFLAIFPLAASLLHLLAARNIALDEAMVLSSSRLRSSKKRNNKK